MSESINKLTTLVDNIDYSTLKQLENSRKIMEIIKSNEEATSLNITEDPLLINSSLQLSVNQIENEKKLIEDMVKNVTVEEIMKSRQRIYVKSLKALQQINNTNGANNLINEPHLAIANSGPILFGCEKPQKTETQPEKKCATEPEKPTETKTDEFYYFKRKKTLFYQRTYQRKPKIEATTTIIDAEATTSKEITTEAVKNCSDTIESLIDLPEEPIKVEQHPKRRSFNSTIYLMPERRQHTKSLKVVLKCRICSQEFASMAKLDSHLKDHVIVKAFRCNICTKSFDDYDRLHLHIEDHKSKTHLVCTYCDKVFNNRYCYYHHIKSHEKDMCEICGKWFASYHLKIHLMRHRNERNFPCALCNMRFNTERERQKHMMSHTDKRPFKCSTCLKRFRKSNTLRMHQLIHTGDKPFSCRFCDHKFNQKGARDSHLLIHTGEMPFECTYCDKKFNKAKSRNDHLLTHGVEKPYKCDLCDKRFVRMSSINNHKCEIKLTEKVSRKRSRKSKKKIVNDTSSENTEESN